MSSGMDRWTGRVAIVTGAGSGIGAAIARLLAESGMTVVGVDRDLQGVQELAASLKSSRLKGELHAVQGDVTREEDVVRVVKWARDTLGGADVLVNNAGVYFKCPLTDFDAEKLRKIFDVNVLGLCMFTREVIKGMRDRGVDDGHIFNICSVMGQRISEQPGVYVYMGSKHAVRVMTEGLRRELRDLKTKIRVTSISPGMVRTGLAEASGMSKEDAACLFNRIPVLEPRDVAGAVLYSLGTPPHVQVHEITIQPIGDIL